jgi:hypothetical protein
MTNLLEAMKEIAHGTKANPICADPAAEVNRVDKIACEALAAHEAADTDQSNKGWEAEALEYIFGKNDPSVFIGMVRENLTPPLPLERFMGRVIDPEDDALDGVLFRFWIRAASYPGGWPSLLAATIEKEIKAEGHATLAAYRRALLAVAKAKGVNLPS